MLNETERKEILTMLKKYEYAHDWLSGHYGSRRAHIVCDKCYNLAGRYLRKMKDNMDAISSSDVKYFALIVDTFEPMRKNSLFAELQKHADFDVVAFVDGCNRVGAKRMLKNKTDSVVEKRVKDMEKSREKYKSLCENISKGNGIVRNSRLAEKYRQDAYAYARAIVKDEVFVSDENLDATYHYLKTICFPYVDGDVADLAKKKLEDRIKNKSDLVDVKKTDKKEKSEVRGFKLGLGAMKQKFAARAKSVFDSVVENRNKKSDADKKWDELAAQQRKAQRDFERSYKKQERDQKKQERVENRKQKKQKIVNSVLNGYGLVVIGLQNLQDEFNKKRDARRAQRLARETAEQKRKSDETKTQPKLNGKHWYRNVIRVAVPVVGLLAIGLGLNALNDNMDKKQQAQKKEVKEVKEVKQTPVVVKNDANKTTQSYAAPIAYDTAYMTAMNNYCNSAMDVIAGEKRKNDVMTKLNNQIQNGNLVLNDTISVERVAYTYFIYREYGFNIDVLNLAVNGNEKLSDAQQAELVKVIQDAGERGRGVQKMARERVESRGGNLGHHSKFERATKQQQRAYLVNRGVLKKVQHNR